jgi:hypothetical protein
MDSSSCTMGRKRRASITEEKDYKHQDKRPKTTITEGGQRCRSDYAVESLQTSTGLSPELKSASQAVDIKDTLAASYEEDCTEEKIADGGAYISAEDRGIVEVGDATKPAQDIDSDEDQEFEDAVPTDSCLAYSTPDLGTIFEKEDDGIKASGDAEVAMSTVEPSLSTNNPIAPKTSKKSNRRKAAVNNSPSTKAKKEHKQKKYVPKPQGPRAKTRINEKGREVLTKYGKEAARHENMTPEEIQAEKDLKAREKAEFKEFGFVKGQAEAPLQVEKYQYESDKPLVAGDPYFEKGCERRMVFASDPILEEYQYQRFRQGEDYKKLGIPEMLNAVDKFINWCQSRPSEARDPDRFKDGRRARHFVLKMDVPNGPIGHADRLAARLRSCWGQFLQTRLRKSHVTIETEIPYHHLIGSDYFKSYMDQILDLMGKDTFKNRFSIKLADEPASLLCRANPNVFYPRIIDWEQEWMQKEAVPQEFRIYILHSVDSNFRQNPNSYQQPTLEQVERAKRFFRDGKEAEKRNLRAAVDTALQSTKTFIEAVRNFELSKTQPSGPVVTKKVPQTTTPTKELKTTKVDDLAAASVLNVVAPLAETSRAKKIVAQTSIRRNSTRYTAPPSAPPTVNPTKPRGATSQNDSIITKGYRNVPPYSNRSDEGIHQSPGPQAISGVHHNVPGGKASHQHSVHDGRPQQQSGIVRPPHPSQPARSSTKHAPMTGSPHMLIVYPLPAAYTKHPPGVPSGCRATDPLTKLPQPQMPKRKPNAAPPTRPITQLPLTHTQQYDPAYGSASPPAHTMPQSPGANAQQLLHEQQQFRVWVQQMARAPRDRPVQPVSLQSSTQPQTSMQDAWPSVVQQDTAQTHFHASQRFTSAHAIDPVQQAAVMSSPAGQVKRKRGSSGENIQEMEGSKRTKMWG